MGQHACSHRRRGDQLDGCQAVPDHQKPTLFAGFGAGRLLPVPQCEEGAGQQNSHPGDPQEGVGEGCENPLGGRLRHALRQWYDCCAKSASTLLADMSRKAKNTKCSYYDRFLFIGSSGFKVNTLCMFYVSNK